jgi:zinc-ribbon domain
MRMSKAVCAACQRKIDDSAKLCPYCGANPVTGERVDTQAILEEVFHPRQITTTESVLEYARQRQGIVIAITSLLALVILAALHQFVTARNSRETTASPAVSLSEIADTANDPHETPKKMPELQFQFDGHPETMRTYLAEPGAIAPGQPAAPPAAAAPAAPPPPAR